MGSKRKRSERRLPTPARPDLVFFVERSLDSSPRFADPLLRAGYRLERFSLHFTDPRTPDPAWIRLCAERGWLALTADRDISSKPEEIDAVMTHGATLYILTSGSGTNHPLLAENLLRTMRLVFAFHRRNKPPFIAKVNRPNARDWEAGKPGSVRIYRTYEDWVANRDRRR